MVTKETIWDLLSEIPDPEIKEISLPIKFDPTGILSFEDPQVKIP